MQRAILSFALLAAIGLAGCDEGKDKPKTIGNDSAQATIPCEAGADCENKWHAARRWVEDNAHFPIAHSTDELIDTDAPSGSLYPVVDVRKVEHEDKLGSDIVFTATCENLIGCVPNEEQFQTSFKDFVDNIEPPEDMGNDIDTGMTFEAAEDDEAGVMVASVAPKSLGAKTGISAGDRILKFNGRSISTPVKLTDAIKATPEGSMVPVEYVHEGQIVVVYMRF